jgi:kynurenine formamidase
MSGQIEPPWRQSKKGSVYCMWGSLPDDIKTQLRQEDRFETILPEFHYRVKRNEDGGYIVFRSTKAEHESRKMQYYSKKPAFKITEFQILSREDANKLLAVNNQFELVGTDPIKVVKEQFFAVVGKREKLESK